MNSSAIIMLIGGLGCIFVAVVYLTEAIKVSKGQFLLSLLVPFYILYFALIKSNKPASVRITLFISIGIVMSPVLVESLNSLF